MARQRGAAAAGEQGEPIGQAVEDLLRREDTGPDRGELDGQRQAVEPADQVGHCRLVGGGQLERARGRGRPLGEQRDRLVLAELGQGFGGTGCGQRERRHRDDVLPRHRERLPAGGDHPQARRRPHQIGHEPCGGASRCSQLSTTNSRRSPAGSDGAAPSARSRPGRAGPGPP